MVKIISPSQLQTCRFLVTEIFCLLWHLWTQGYTILQRVLKIIKYEMQPKETNVMHNSEKPNHPCCCCSVAKSCLILCNPLDCNPPCSSVHGIFQARILEWVANFSSRGSSSPRDRTLTTFLMLQFMFYWEIILQQAELAVLILKFPLGWSTFPHPRDPLSDCFFSNLPFFHHVISAVPSPSSLSSRDLASTPSGSPRSGCCPRSHCPSSRSTSF